MRSRWIRLTVIELFVIAVLAAAAVAVGVWWSARERSLDSVETMKDDLRNLAAAQEAYAADNEGAFMPQNSRVTTTLPHYGYAPSAGVTVEISEPRPDGWSATATHELVPGRLCGIFAGEPAPGPPNPASDPGEPACN